MNGKYKIQMNGMPGTRVGILQANLEKLFKHGYVLSSARYKKWEMVSRDYWTSTLTDVKYVVIGDDAECKMVIHFYHEFSSTSHLHDFEIVASADELLKKEGLLGEA